MSSWALCLVFALAICFDALRLAAALPRKGIRLAAIGDFGADTSREREVANLVASWEPLDAILALGDTNYPTGSKESIDHNVGKYYSQYMYPYKGKFGKGAKNGVNRFWPCPGNHDYGSAALERDRRKGKDTLAPYLEYMPVGGRRFYDVQLGAVHLFSLDSNRQQKQLNGTGPNSQQAEWLRARLTSSASPWRIVFFHQPPFSSGSHGSTPYMRWPFELWGASAVLSGHDHSYERVTHAGGFPYFVNGMGGARTYGFNLRPVSASAVRHTGHGGAQLVEADERSMTIKFVSTAERRVVDCYGAVQLPAVQPQAVQTNGTGLEHGNGTAAAGAQDAAQAVALPRVLYGNCTEVARMRNILDSGDAEAVAELGRMQERQHQLRITSVKIQAAESSTFSEGVRMRHSTRLRKAHNMTGVGGTAMAVAAGQCLHLHQLCRNATAPCCEPYVCLPMSRRCGIGDTRGQLRGHVRTRGVG